MDEEGSGPRVGQIRSAIRTIRNGTRGVEAVFSEARGPLSKSAVRNLHQRIKELRQTAESAEGAFREWTLDLAGQPRGAEHAEHDALRATFEAEVAGIQQSMLRIAEEVKRRKVAKRASADDAAAESEAGEEPSTSASTFPRELPHTAAPPPQRSASLPSQAPARSMEERASSHAAMASTLRLIASQEEEVRLDRKSRQAEEHVITLGARPDVATKGRSGGMHPYMKYILGIALVILGYTLYSHARLVIIHTSMHSPAERGEAVPPAAPRRLR